MILLSIFLELLTQQEELIQRLKKKREKKNTINTDKRGW